MYPMNVVLLELEYSDAFNAQLSKLGGIGCQSILRSDFGVSDRSLLATAMFGGSLSTTQSLLWRPPNY